MINKESVGPINTQMRLEVKKMRDLRHVNVASFVGACCDSPNICVLMEVAPKVNLSYNSEAKIFVLLRGVWMICWLMKLLILTGTSSIPFLK